jgi:hypothetical protein
VFVLLVAGCGGRDTDPTFLIQVRPGKIQGDKELMNRPDFEETLRMRLEYFKEPGNSKEKGSIRLKLQEDLIKRAIQDVEEALKRLGLTRIERTVMHRWG